MKPYLSLKTLMCLLALVFTTFFCCSFTYICKYLNKCAVTLLRESNKLIKSLLSKSDFYNVAQTDVIFE